MSASVPNLRCGYLEEASWGSRLYSPAAKSGTLKLNLEDYELNDKWTPEVWTSTIDASYLPRSPPLKVLDWTCSQKPVVSDDGSGVACEVGLPLRSDPRAHKIQPARSIRIESTASRAKSVAAIHSKPLHGRHRERPQTEQPGRRRERPEGEQIHVTLSDFRRCGNDLSLLRKCHIHPHARPTAEYVHPYARPTAEYSNGKTLDMSFRSAFNSRCREQTELRDPWQGHHPEAFRLHSENDHILNQVSLESLQSKKLEYDPDACAPSTASTRASSVDSCSPKGSARAARKRLTSGRASQPDLRRRSDELQVSHKAESRQTSNWTSPIQPLNLEPEADLTEELPQSKYTAPADRRFMRELAPKSGENFVVWFSLDPDSGEICFYSRPAAKRLEVGYRDGRCSVPLAGLGDRLDDVIVDFEGGTRLGTRRTGSKGANTRSGSKGNRSGSKTSISSRRFVEKSWNGSSRDVARLTVASSWEDLGVKVAWDTSVCQWRLANNAEGSPLDTSVVTRRVRLTGEELLPPPSPSLPPLPRDRRVCFVSPAFA